MPDIIINAYDFLPKQKIMTDRIVALADTAQLNGYTPIVVSYLPPEEVSRLGEYTEVNDKVVISEARGYPVYYILEEKKLTGRRGFLRAAANKYLGPIIDGLWGYRRHRQLLLELIDRYNPSAIIYSVNPFGLMGLGARVYRKRPVPWIIDYRDDWSTNEIRTNTLLKKLYTRSLKPLEKYWSRSAAFFLSVTDYYVQKISDLIRKNGIVVENGYLRSDIRDVAVPENEKMTIVYSGSLYMHKPVVVFIQGMVQFLADNPQAKITVQFLSLLDQPKSLARVKAAIPEKYKSYFEFTHRLAKEEAQEIQNQSDALLFIGRPGQKGSAGSKIYGYILTQKPVILCPSDGDLAEKMLLDSGQALIADTADQMQELASILYSEWQKNGHLALTKKKLDVEKFTREYQSQKLFYDPKFKEIMAKKPE